MLLALGLLLAMFGWKVAALYLGMGLGVAIGWLTVRAVGALRARRQRTR